MRNFLAASLIAADFWNLEKEFAKLKKTNIEWIHYDIMDGHFVPNITVGSCELDSLVMKSPIPIDLHFMVSNPDYIVPKFIKRYSNRKIANITVHLETCKNIKRLSNLARKNKIGFGLAINPSTSISGLVKQLKHIDLALIMTVRPGFAGQKIIPSCFKKVSLSAKTKLTTISEITNNCTYKDTKVFYNHVAFHIPKITTKKAIYRSLNLSF